MAYRKILIFFITHLRELRRHLKTWKSLCSELIGKTTQSSFAVGNIFYKNKNKKLSQNGVVGYHAKGPGFESANSSEQIQSLWFFFFVILHWFGEKDALSCIPYS